MVRSASATRVAANADKIRALVRGDGERKPRVRGADRPQSRQEEDEEMEPGQEQGDRLPTDILSDGYDSGGDAGSERVLALLRSGISARQSMDLHNASSDYKRAASLQKSRKSKPRNKYTIWLRGLAKQHGKEAVRKAARDIQRCYRGMLGREDAAWHRLQRKKKLRAAQAALDAKQQREATAVLQRCFRGHRGRLQAGWRRRIRAERTGAAAVLQACARRVAGQKVLLRLRQDAARTEAAASLQGRMRAALWRAQVARDRSNAAKCLQRVARWAQSEQQLAALLREQAAAIVAAACARACARSSLLDLRRAEDERRQREAELEAARRLWARKTAAATSIAAAVRQRRARRLVGQRLAVRQLPWMGAKAEAAPPNTTVSQAQHSYAKDTKSSSAKRADSLATAVALAAATAPAVALSPPTATAGGHLMPSDLARKLAERLSAWRESEALSLSEREVREALVMSAQMSRQAAAATMLRRAWHVRAARRRMEARRALRAQKQRRIEGVAAATVQRWWLVCSLGRCLRRRHRHVAEQAAHTAAAAVLLRDYGAEGAAAALVVLGSVRCWLARQQVMRRQEMFRDDRMRGQQCAAGLTVVCAWRGRTARRRVREARERQQHHAREVAALRIAGAMGARGDRQAAADHMKEARTRRREQAATRVQGAMRQRRARKVMRALALADEHRMALLREDAAQAISRAWRSGKSRRLLRDARWQRAAVEAERTAREMAWERLAASRLQGCVRRLWAQWTMSFYVSVRVPLCASFGARVASQPACVEEHPRAAAACRTIGYADGIVELMRCFNLSVDHIWSTKFVHGLNRLPLAGAHLPPLPLSSLLPSLPPSPLPTLIPRAQHTHVVRLQCATRAWRSRQAHAAIRVERRQVEVVAATTRLIAAVKCRAAHTELVRMRSSAILLECAWRGSKARDVSAT